jgi:hypothetical protein
MPHRADPGYGRCPCGGRYEARFVQVRITVNGEPLERDEVPQGRCPRCGSAVYRADLLELLEADMRGESAPPPRARF